MSEQQSQSAVSTRIPPTRHGWTRALLLSVLMIFPLFISSSIGYAYQALRSVPVFGTSGAMNDFVGAVERATDEVQSLADDRWQGRLDLGRVELADPSTRALERFALLQARDLMRLHLGPEGRLPAEINYIETETALWELCSFAQTRTGSANRWSLPADPAALEELQVQCQPEPTCTGYRSWVESDASRRLVAVVGAGTDLTGPDAGEPVQPPPEPASLRGRPLDAVTPAPTSKETAQAAVTAGEADAGAAAAAAASTEPAISTEAASAATQTTPQRPSVRALLGCSQRDILVAGVQRQAVNVYDPLPGEIAVASLRLRYPDIEGSEWGAIRSFVDSYRILVPDITRICPVRSETTARGKSASASCSGWQMVQKVGAVTWGSLWQAILWVPLFLSYLLLAILAGGLSGYLGQGHLQPTSARIISGAAAALVLVGITLAGINLATIGMPRVDGIPNPGVVLMMSLLAGAVGHQIVTRIKAAAGALFNAPPGGSNTQASSSVRLLGEQAAPQADTVAVINVRADPPKPGA